MFSAILILLIMPFVDMSRSRGTQFKPLTKAAFFIFVGNFLILMELGAKHVESPFIEFGQISTVIYFAHFLIIVPLISLLENTLIEIANEKGVMYHTEHTTAHSALGHMDNYSDNKKGVRSSSASVTGDLTGVKLEENFKKNQPNVMWFFLLFVLFLYLKNTFIAPHSYCDAPRP